MCQVRRLQSVIIASYKVMGIRLQNATFGLRSATGVKKCEKNTNFGVITKCNITNVRALIKKRASL